jgi:hypothetical protein
MGYEAGVHDGAFLPGCGVATFIENFKNRLIDADNRRNRADRGWSKFVFEIKSADF